MSEINGLESLYELGERTQITPLVFDTPSVAAELPVQLDDYEDLFRPEDESLASLRRTSDERYVVHRDEFGVEYVEVPDEDLGALGIVVTPQHETASRADDTPLAKVTPPSQTESYEPVSDHTSIINIVQHRNGWMDVNLKVDSRNESAKLIFAALAGTTAPTATSVSDPQKEQSNYPTIESSATELPQQIFDQDVQDSQLDSLLFEEQAAHDPLLNRRRVMMGAKIAAVVALALVPTRVWQYASGGDPFFDFYHPTHLVEKPYGDIAPIVDGVLSATGVKD